MTLATKRSLSLAALTLGFFAGEIRAATIVNQTFSGSFPANLTGTLPNQDTAIEEMFMLAAAGNFTASTTSFATGGFQPNLTLFDSNGNFVATGATPGTSPVAQKDPNTGAALDAFLNIPNLAAGKYTLALTDFLLNQSLTATNLSAGFGANYGSGTTFVDEMGNTRNGNFALAISVSPAASAVPEPATLWMMIPLVGAVTLRMRRRSA